MNKILKKFGMESSVPLVLLLVAILSFTIFLFLAKFLPENNWLDKPIYTSCIQYQNYNNCDSVTYLMIFAIITMLILFGPALIVLKIFSINFIPEGWIILSIVFSFFIYFLIDYLVSFIRKKEK